MGEKKAVYGCRECRCGLVSSCTGMDKGDRGILCKGRRGGMGSLFTQVKCTFKIRG